MRTLWALLIFALWQQVALATVPSQFSVQGVLRTGGQLQSMPFNLTVKLYNDRTSTDAAALLGIPVNTQMVGATNGLFTIGINVDPDLMTKLATAPQVWLEITAGNDTFPRQLVTPDIYALMCRSADRIRDVDVAVQAPASGQFLRYDGAKWTPSPILAGDASSYVVTGNISDVDIYPVGPAIAHLPFNAPGDGYALVNWTVTVGLNATVGSCDIIIGAFTSSRSPAFTDPYVSYAYLPSYPRYQQVSMSGSAVLAVARGANTIYLDATVCAESYYRRPVMTVRFERTASVTTGQLIAQ